MNRIMTFLAAAAILLILSSAAVAQEPSGTFGFNFQGRLSNALGEPVPDGNYQMRLFIYADSVGGTPLWTELHPAVPIEGGSFNIDAGSVVPCSLSIPSLANIFLAAQIGTEPPMPRRLRISMAPNSAVARRICGDLVSSPGSLKFLDDGSEYMGIEPSPWHPGGDLIMKGDGGVQTMILGSDGTMSMIHDGTEFMGVDPVPWHTGGDLTMYDGGVQTIVFGSNGTMSMLDDGSEYMGIEPVPWHAGGDLTMYDGGVQTMVFGSNGTLSMLDDGTKYMGVEPAPWHAGGDLMMYDATGAQTLLLASNGMASIGTGNHTNILTIRQYSSTDPIADAWTTYSSRRWKTNIQPLHGALDKVMRLNGVTFDWIEGNKHDIGLIAEDVGRVVPEVVAYEDNGVDAKSVDYARLSALLIEAVKEQQKTIDELQSEIDEVKAQINQ